MQIEAGILPGCVVVLLQRLSRCLPILLELRTYPPTPTPKPYPQRTLTKTREYPVILLKRCTWAALTDCDDPSYGALPQLWAGTSPEGKDLNGKVAILIDQNNQILKRSFVLGLSTSSHGSKSFRPVRTAKIPRQVISCRRGWRGRSRVSGRLYSRHMHCSFEIWIWGAVYRMALSPSLGRITHQNFIYLYR